jgi:hypothetical protein
MKLTRLTAAVIAAATAITPLSFNASAPISYAEDTGAVAKLPDWIPSDFDSAVEFRNSYGATHIDNGLICLVYPDRARKGRSADTYGYELKPTAGMGLELKHEIYTHELTETCFDVFVYQPQKQGDIDLTIVDPHVQVKETPDDWEPPAIAEYSFTIGKNLSITETDIFSWLPDSMTEYDEYTKKNGNVSVNGNYVVFCTMAVDQLGDRWEPDYNNKYENIKYLLTSDCTMQVPDLYDDGSIDKIYVYQAVKDGYEKISWIRTSKAEPTSYTLTADCAVLDNAQTILLSGDMRVTLVDYDTGEPLALPEGAMPRIWTDIRQSTSDGEIKCNMQPVGFRNNPDIVGLGNFFDGYNFSFGLLDIPESYSLPETEEKSAGYYNGTIVPEDHITVKKYDNNTADVVFRLKKTARRVLPEEKSADLTDLEKGETRITFYDKDTGELIPSELVKNHNLGFSTDIRFRSNMSPDGWMYTGPVYRADSNPQVYQTDLANLYRSADIFEFLCDDQPEVTLYDNGSMELVIRTRIKVSGNINGDSKFNIADLVALQKWLLNAYDKEFYDWAEADFDLDNKLTVFDLVLMRKALLKSIDLPVEVSVTESGGVAGAMIIYNVYCEGKKYFLSYQDLTYAQEPQSIIIQISEQEYREIMAQDYDSMMQNMNNPDGPEWSECEFRLELTYSDGSKIKTVSDRTPGITTKLRDLKDKYSYYVNPDESFEYGVPFFVLEDGLKLYQGPDERYSTIACIPADTRLIEKGAQNNNNEWLFTEYNGQYGWIKVFKDDGKTPTIYFEQVARKPVIYLYPEQETDVHIELELTEAELSTTYPKYNAGWDVTAYPDGSLLNKADGTHHRYLFWDAVNCRTRYDFSKGFCVAGGDTERFLKEKLTYMGLTEDEMNEFIVYWLPLMEHNKYNLISFQGDVYTDSAKLNITPTPDSMLRIFMTYVPLEEAVDIEPQQLSTFERKGFTVVEWGGSKIQ